MFDNAVQAIKYIKMFDQMFNVIQILSNVIKHESIQSNKGRVDQSLIKLTQDKREF